MEKKYLTRDKIIGKQVIDANAIIVGTVKDLSFDLAAKEVSLTITTRASTEVNVSSENVSGVGDVILLNRAIDMPERAPERPPTPIAAPPQPSAPRTSGLCQACGYQNDPTSKFCIKCGSKLQAP